MPVKNPKSTAKTTVAVLLDWDGSHRARISTAHVKVVTIMILNRPNRSAKYPGTIRPRIDAPFRIEERLYARESPSPWD